MDGAAISHCQLLKLSIFEYHQRFLKLRKIRNYSETVPLLKNSTKPLSRYDLIEYNPFGNMWCNISIWAKIARILQIFGVYEIFDFFFVSQIFYEYVLNIFGLKLYETMYTDNGSLSNWFTVRHLTIDTEFCMKYPFWNLWGPISLLWLGSAFA